METIGREADIRDDAALPLSFADAAAAGRTRPLVLGFGNVLLGDDGAGVRVVERLRAELGAAAAQFVDAGTLSFSLLSYVECADTMLVVDAAQLGGVAGAIDCFEGEAMDRFLQSARRRSVHEIGLIDLLDMARLLRRLPARRALLCIQPASIDWSERLSPALEAALPDGLQVAKALLRRWGSP